MSQVREATWQTRITAIVVIGALTALAMLLEIDGALVYALGVAAAAGLAGYDIGMDHALRLARRDA